MHFLKLWIDIIITNIQNETLDPEETISLIAEIFDMNMRAFLEFRCTPFMIAYMFKVCHIQQINDIMEYLSGILHMPIKDIIISNFVVCTLFLAMRVI